MNAVTCSFATRLNLRPGQAQHLIALANKAADVQTNWHNGDASEEQVDTAIKQVDDYASRFGIKTDWNPGLYPVFIAPNGERLNLPD